MIMDAINSFFIALFAAGDDYYTSYGKPDYEEFDVDKRVVDVKRYHYDLETKGQSYVDIARDNGMYSYIM